MHTYKYGIVVHQKLNREPPEWRIALLDVTVSGHGFIDVPARSFNFDPRPGSSVKAKFENEFDDLPSIITTSTEYEWIRDVQVIDSKVVIHIITKLSSECLERTAKKEDTNIQYYLIQNDETDFRKIAIPKTVLDKELSNRSSLQKQGEPLVYRVGVCWDPFRLDNNMHVYWRYYEDIPIVPIFELYYRETTLPYLSDGMIYGVLEGIIIASNEEGVLFWTVGMGCAVLSSVTRGSEMPPLGSVHFVLAKRSLPEKSFGFSCFYELLPELRDHKWDGVKIISDETSGTVYVEAHCECVKMTDSDNLAMLVPHFGKIYRGLSRYKERLVIGKMYHFRVEFQQENDAYVPVIVDLCLEEDETVQCRVVHVSKETHCYHAILEPRGDAFERTKQSIDFIKIPFRVLFCAKRVFVENEELLMNIYNVRIRRARKDHDVVDAVHVYDYGPSRKDQAFSVLNRTVWLRTMVSVKSDCPGPRILHCPRLEQLIMDFTRLSDEMPKNITFAVHAQFVLTPENAPTFWARSVAPTIHQLAKLTVQAAVSLPSLQDTLASTKSSTEVQSTSESPTKSELKSEKTMDDEATNDPDALNANRRNERSLQTEDEQSVRAELDRSILQESFQSSEDIVFTESMLASSSSASITSRADSFVSCNSKLQGQIVTESCFGDTTCSIISDEPGIKDVEIDIEKLNVSAGYPPRRSLFRNTANEGNRRQGFGPSSFNYGSASPRENRPHRTRPLRYGTRQLNYKVNHKKILEDIVYRFMKNRLMFIDNEREAKESWFRTPFGKVTTTKKTVSQVVPIEITKCRSEQSRARPRFTDLVRFVVLDQTMNTRDVSVVVAIGGLFPTMPKSFQLGERYKVEHFSFPSDRMCRFGGFAMALRHFMFVREDRMDEMRNTQLMENEIGNEFLRFTTTVSRPCEPKLNSDVFEIWNCDYLPGLIIVEKKPELMKALEPIELKDDDSHVYSAVIEPVAGGPMEVSILKEEQNDYYFGDREMYVFWRLVVEFSDNVPMPVLVDKRKIHKPEPQRKFHVPPHNIKDYGMWKTMHINSQLAQERLDRLRALNDPRIKLLEGPDLKPEIEIRKVHVNTRRDSMFNAMEMFLEKLPSLQSYGYYNYVFEEDYVALMEKLRKNDDNFHEFQFKKRMYSLTVGVEYLTNLLLKNDHYKKLKEEVKFEPLLQVIATSLHLNATYVKKTVEATKMLHFFRKHKMIPYD